MATATEEKAIPLGKITLEWLSTCSPDALQVTLAMFEATMEIRIKGMAGCADHMLRRIFMHRTLGFKYDPGDEPRIEFVDATCRKEEIHPTPDTPTHRGPAAGG